MSCSDPGASLRRWGGVSRASCIPCGCCCLPRSCRNLVRPPNTYTRTNTYAAVACTQNDRTMCYKTQLTNTTSATIPPTMQNVQVCACDLVRSTKTVLGHTPRDPGEVQGSGFEEYRGFASCGRAWRLCLAQIQTGGTEDNRKGAYPTPPKPRSVSNDSHTYTANTLPHTPSRRGMGSFQPSLCPAVTAPRP